MRRAVVEENEQRIETAMTAALNIDRAPLFALHSLGMSGRIDKQQPPASCGIQAETVLSHTTGTAARQGAEAPIPPYTNKYKGGTLESPSRVRAGTAKGRSPQQTCVGWNRRRVGALSNAPPLRPCETPALMMRKQAAYRRSQHGALRSRSPPTIRLTLYQCRVE